MILHVYSLTVDITGYVHRAKMVPVFFSKIYSGNLSCNVNVTLCFFCLIAWYYDGS